MSKPSRRSKRQSPRTDADPEPWRRHLSEGCSDPKAVAFAKQFYQTRLHRLSAFRKMVNVIGLHRVCPRRACRRGGRCDEAVEIPCFRLFRNTLREAMAPALPMMRARFGEPTDDDRT